MTPPRRTGAVYNCSPEAPSLGGWGGYPYREKNISLCYRPLQLKEQIYPLQCTRKISMIHNPLLLILVLLAVEFSILYLSSHARTKHLFSFLPSMFWIYFLPMLLSTCGIIDAKSPLYQGITKFLLPPARFLAV